MVKVWIFSQKRLWEQKQGKQLGFCSPYTDPISISVSTGVMSQIRNPVLFKVHQWLTNGWGGTFLTKPGYCPQPRGNCWEGYASFPPTTTKHGKERRISDMLCCGENQAAWQVYCIYKDDASLVKSKPSHLSAGPIGLYQLKKIKCQFVCRNSQILSKHWL